MTRVDAKELTFAYPGGAPVLNKLTFSLDAVYEAAAGKVIAVMGPSGCGKSTLLRLLAGLEVPTSGSIVIEPPPSCVPYLTQDAVILPQYSRDANARYRSFAGAFKSRFSETRFAELQASLGLCDDFLRSRTSVSALSGGERQRLALLRDISIAPDLLLLDEPCNGLDQSLKVELLQQLRRIVADHRVLVIYVSHHRDEVEMVADEIAVLEPAVASAPQRLCVGSASSVLEAPPSLLAAKLLAYPACNVVECYVQPGGILVPVSEQVTSAASSRTVCVAFGLDTARLHERGAKAMVVGQTAAITYVRLGRDGPVLAMRASASNGSRIHFDGPAWLFEDPKARAVAGTLLCCTKEPEACLRFRPS